MQFYVCDIDLDLDLLILRDKHGIIVFVKYFSPTGAVTLHVSSMPSGYLSPTLDRIRQVSVTTFEACTCVQLASETLFLKLNVLHRLD